MDVAAGAEPYDKSLIAFATGINPIRVLSARLLDLDTGAAEPPSVRRMQ